MLRFLNILLTLILICFCIPLDAAPQLSKSSKETRILFIGNSFTYVGKMPSILEEFCKHRKIPVHIEMVAPGGWNLEYHADAKMTPATAAALTKNWDIVVMQDQSQRPAFSPEGTLASGKKLAEQVKRTGAQPVLFLTWGYAQEDGTMNPHMQKALTDAYCNLGKAIGAKIAPVGPAWEAALKKDLKKFNALYAKDDPNCHPSRLGAYYNACIFYTVLFNKPCTGLPAAGKYFKINPMQARELQQIADTCVKNFPQPNQKK